MDDKVTILFLHNFVFKQTLILNGKTIFEPLGVKRVFRKNLGWTKVIYPLHYWSLTVLSLKLPAPATGFGTVAPSIIIHYHIHIKPYSVASEFHKKQP